MNSRQVLAVVGILVAAPLLLSAVGCGSPDAPEELPGYHHADPKDYKWEVVIDPRDEGWKFWTDTEPTFTLQTTDEGAAQTVVCMKNAREENDNDKDRYYTGDEPYCVGGEGKIKIIPQGTRIKY